MIKILKLIMVIILIIILLITIYSLINDSIQKKKENALINEKRSSVELTKNGVSVYTQGKGTQTLVFLSGGGTPSPMYDFKSLYTLLEDEYKIVVIEKKGYGFSIADSTQRSLEVMLAETRDSLKELDIEGPYILLPHSMSGLEAIFWAQTYPEEVRAIIGLDMATPEAYQNMDLPNNFSTAMLSGLHKIGFLRLFPSLALEQSPALISGNLNSEEKNMYRALFYKNFMSESFLNEIRSIDKNILSIKQKEIPQVKTLLLVSNGEGTSFDEKTWLEFQKNYFEQLNNAEIEYFDCPHYLHDYEYENISKRIKEYINTHL